MIVAVLVLAAPAAHAVINSADGRATASVQQVDASTGAIVDQALDQTPDTTNALPAQASVALDIGSPSAIMGGLTAVAAVSPPAAGSLENTRDFNFEAEGLSLLSNSGFACEVTSVEDRQVVLGAAELGLASGTAIHVRSTFVLSAGIFLATLPEGSANVDGTVTFTVSQQDGGGSRDVLVGTLHVFFDANRQLQIDKAGGASQAIALPFDFSGRSSRLDQVHLVLFPYISIPYEYDATVDAPFALTAQVRGDVNAPAGSQGGSVFLGQLPTAFLQSLNQRLGADFSGSVGVATTAAAVQRTVGLSDSQMEITPVSSRPCGDFGWESLLGALGLGLAFARRRLV